jgi:hypothetical protein
MLKNASPVFVALAPSRPFVKTRMSIFMLTLAPSLSKRNWREVDTSLGWADFVAPAKFFVLAVKNFFSSEKLKILRLIVPIASDPITN